MNAGCGIRLKWMGCASFEIDFGSVTVVTDPWITDNPRNGLSWKDIEKCDYIVLSHSHFDHITDIPSLALRFDPFVLCGDMTAYTLMKWADLNPMKVFPLSAGTSIQLDQLRITALYGRHTLLPGTYSERKKRWEESAYCGGDPEFIHLNQIGDFEYRNYLFTLSNGMKLLTWGNMLSWPGQRAFLKESGADVAVLQMTKKNDPREMAEVCGEMGCRIVIPQHTDFPLDYSDQGKQLKEELAVIAPEIHCIIPEYGKWISL